MRERANERTKRTQVTTIYLISNASQEGPNSAVLYRFVHLSRRLQTPA